MLILGVDPGTVTTGYGIVRKRKPTPVYVAGGIIRPGASKPQPERLLVIYTALDKIICEFQPSVMVVESLFHAVNSQSLIKLGQVRGVILLLGASHGMDVFEYSPREIKQGITGYGQADKTQMIYMVRKYCESMISNLLTKRMLLLWPLFTPTLTLRIRYQNDCVSQRSIDF